MRKATYLLATALCTLCLLTESQVATAKKGMPKHVIIVGFDGLSARSITDGADMPNLRKLMSEGSYTLKQRSILPSSSACNWASMFKGAGPELHGFTNWGTQKPEVQPPIANRNGQFPAIFDLYREKSAAAEIGYLYEWGGMRYVVDTLAMSYKLHAEPNDANPEGILNSGVSYIKEKKPNLCALIFHEPDGVGHSIGWSSPAYMAKVTMLDSYLGKVVAAVKEAGIMNETVIIVVADHGGVNKGHGGTSMNEMQTPLVFFGKGIKRNFQIPESTMVYDVAATVAYMLKVQQPQAWIARPITSIFE